MRAAARSPDCWHAQAVGTAWLAARLPLTFALRLHLLACPCPLQRMRDLVVALRLLRDPRGRGGHAARRLEVKWLRPSSRDESAQRPVVDWSTGSRQSWV